MSSNKRCRSCIRTLYLHFAFFTVLFSFFHGSVLAQTSADQLVINAVADEASVAVMSLQNSAYSVQVSGVTLNIAADLSFVDAKTQVLEGQVDFATAIVGLTLEEAANFPSVLVLPIFATAVAPVYNIPTFLSAQEPLVFSAQTIGKILTGNITRWNDPSIISDNPLVVLPNNSITVILEGAPRAKNIWMANYLCSTFPIFCGLSYFDNNGISIVGNPASYANFVSVGSDFAEGHVLRTPYSFSFTFFSNIQEFNMQYAFLKSTTGRILQPTQATVAFALTDAGTAPTIMTPYGSMHDLTNLNAATIAWPLSGLVYLIIDSQHAHTICAIRAAVVDFWLYFCTSNVVQSLANAYSFAMVQGILLDQFNVLNTLTSSIYCLNGNLAIPQTTTTSNIVLAMAVVFQLVSSLLVSAYAGLDSQYTFQVATTPSNLGAQGILHQESDAALVGHPLLTAAVTAEVIASSLVSFLPAYLSNVVPVFNLGAAGSSTLPLILDLHLLADIFLGNVKSWLDPQIVALNPSLPARFAAVPGLQSNITIFICCRESTTNTAIATILIRALRMVPAFAAVFPNGATDMTLLLHASNNSNAIQVLASENNLREVVLRTPMAVSYGITTSPSSDNTQEVRIIRHADLTQRVTSLPDSAANLVYPNSGAITTDYGIWTGVTDTAMTSSTLNSMAACSDVFPSQASLDALLLTSSNANVNLPIFDPLLSSNPQCYPFTFLLSFVVSLVLQDGTDCVKSNHTLSFIKYIISHPEFSATTSSQGVLSLQSVFPAMTETAVVLIDRITCNGENLLVVLPVIWSLNPGIADFAWTFAIVGIVACGVTSGLVIQYRKRVVFKSASFMFLLQTLLGLIFIFGAVMALADPNGATDTNCQAMLWLANLGFTTTFGPLFVKTWRIYRIFGTKKLNTMKLGDHKLAMMVGCLLAFDFLVLIVWQAVAPLSASYSIVQDNGKDHWYMQCNAGSEGQNYAIVMVVTKAALVLFGCLMAFGTRRVTTTFNESKQIAWAIYNTVFGCAIIIPIIFVIGAIGDTLILLEVFLALWIGFFTWAILFVPKLHALAENNDGFSEEASIRESTDGFSFLSVVSLPESILTKYVMALEKQLKAGKDRLAILRKVAGPPGTGGTNRTVGGATNASKLASVVGGGGANAVSHAKKNSYVSQSGKSALSPNAKPQTENASLLGNPGTATGSTIASNPGEVKGTTQRGSVIQFTTGYDSNNNSTDSALKYRQPTIAVLNSKAEGVVRNDPTPFQLSVPSIASPTASSASASASSDENKTLFTAFTPASKITTSMSQAPPTQLNANVFQIMQQASQLQQQQMVPALIGQQIMQNLRFNQFGTSKPPMQPFMSPTSSTPSSPSVSVTSLMRNSGVGGSNAPLLIAGANPQFPTGSIVLLGTRGSISQPFQTSSAQQPAQRTGV